MWAKLIRGQVPCPVTTYKSLGAVTRKRTLGKSWITDVGVRLSSWKGGKKGEIGREEGREGRMEGGKEKEEEGNKEPEILHTPGMWSDPYIVKYPSLHIKTGRPAYPTEGDLKGRIKVGQKSFPVSLCIFFIGNKNACHSWNNKTHSWDCSWKVLARWETHHTAE